MKAALGIWFSVMAFVSAGALEFKAPLQEIHAKLDEKNVTAEFEFTNKSDKEVTVIKYKAFCDCVSLKIKEGKLRYEPGESGLIRAEFNLANQAGVVNKDVGIWLDGDPAEKPSVHLTLRVHIPVLIEIEPKSLKWDQGGKGGPQTMTIRMKHNKPIHIKAITTASQTFKHELKTVEDGKHYELTLTPADVGNIHLVPFRIETDCDIKSYQVQQVFGAIQKAKPSKP
jgi:hypothetical protein